MTLPSDFLPFRITVCGLAELEGHRAVGVSHVLSILDPGAPSPPALGAYGEHARLDLRFHDIVEERPGMHLAQREDIALLLRFARDIGASAGAHLLVHCQMGVSRSAAAMVLAIAQARPDQPADAVIAALAAIRRRAWPNLRVIELGDALLGRRGELVAAARRRYGFMIRNRPEIAEAMRRLGRWREIDGALFDG